MTNIRCAVQYVAKFSFASWFIVPLSMLSASAFAETYSYDAAGRLTAVVYDDGSSVTYTYDLNSNLLQMDADSNGINSPPGCSNVSLTTDFDTVGTVTADCSDFDGNPLTYAIVSQPANGTAAVIGGDLSYTPNAGYSGSDSFSYNANDGAADSGVATVSVTVNPVSSPAVATARLAGGSADPITTVVAGAQADVVLLSFEFEMAFDGDLSSLTLQAGGTGNVVSDITQVKLYEDTDGDGAVSAADTLVGGGRFSAGRSLDLAFAQPHRVSAGTTRFLVTYDFGN